MLLGPLQKLGVLAIVVGSCTADILFPLPQSASDGALKFQPVLDFDKDACYQTAAIGLDGRVNQGLDQFKGNCRERAELFWAQTYVRQRCNHGWCAYMYAYYFETDIGGWVGGHKHDWEHAVVWTLNDEIAFVSWSHHGKYSVGHHSAVRFQGDHPKLVYHRGGGATHSFRLAEPADDKIENVTGEWFKATLLDVDRMPGDKREKLLKNDWGHGRMDIADDRFGDALNKAMPWDAKNNEHFDPWN